MGNGFDWFRPSCCFFIFVATCDFGFDSSSASSFSMAEMELASASIESASTLARNFALYFKLRGFVLNLYQQQGHKSPSHLMKISQI